MSTLQSEQEIIEGGYTRGAFNRYHHAAIAATARQTDGSITGHESGHLVFQRGLGVMRTKSEPCSLCKDWGLTDKNWHPVPQEVV